MMLKIQLCHHRNTLSLKMYIHKIDIKYMKTLNYNYISQYNHVYCIFFYQISVTLVSINILTPNF